jgi:serine-type D-Ala-D-Ala endopeptidase (penicillin-binding protein 7)
MKLKKIIPLVVVALLGVASILPLDVSAAPAKKATAAKAATKATASAKATNQAAAGKKAVKLKTASNQKAAGSQAAGAAQKLKVSAAKRATAPRSVAAAKSGRTDRAGRKALAVAKARAQPRVAKSHMSRHERVVAQREARKQAALAAASRDANRYATDEDGNPLLGSAAAVVQDQASGAVLFEKNSGAVLPIASITKLMTAMVVLDSKLNLQEVITIGYEDVDTLRGSHSRLAVGTRLTREDMLRLALMSSENRASFSLSRHYPGGNRAFIQAMNQKARSLGLTDTRFFDPTGLNAGNVSSGRDLAKMVATASSYPLIREFSTTTEYAVEVNGRSRSFHNTNALVSSPDWQIGVSKTGYISEAGRCLVMQAWLNEKPMIIVLLDSLGKSTRLADAKRIKRWIESASLSTGGAG